MAYDRSAGKSFCSSYDGSNLLSDTWRTTRRGCLDRAQSLWQRSLPSRNHGCLDTSVSRVCSSADSTVAESSPTPGPMTRIEHLTEVQSRGYAGGREEHTLATTQAAGCSCSAVSTPPTPI